MVAPSILASAEAQPEVKSSDIVAIINPLWHDKPRTAQMVRMHLSTVMKWAMTNEHRTNNPAEQGVTQQMRNKKRSRQSAIPGLSPCWAAP